MSGYVELYIDQGTDYNVTLVVQDDITNRYQNLDNYIITSQLKRSLLSQNTSGEFECSVSDEANGEIALSMTGSDTSNLHIGTHMFDVRINVGGTISRLIEGIVIVTPGITS